MPWFLRVALIDHFCKFPKISRNGYKNGYIGKSQKCFADR
jgi:hypothetical protein